MPPILPVIMCGGAGSRLWPASRDAHPKQFLPLLSELSTFQSAVKMFSGNEQFAKPMVLTHKDYRVFACAQMLKIGVDADVVLEPIRRNSATAVAIAVELACRRDPQTIIAIVAADHYIEDHSKFIHFIERAADIAAHGYIVTLGVKPTHAATSYGYIKLGAKISNDAYKVASFVEKPRAKAAKDYVDAGMLWNCGNFIFRAEVMRNELMKFHPNIVRAVSEAVDHATRSHNCSLLAQESLKRAPKISIDFAVIEHTKRAAVLPIDVNWSDVGTWTALRDLLPKDAKGNIIQGRAFLQDCSNVMVRSADKMTAVIGVDNVIVVTTKDAVLVLNPDQADQVKQIVEKMTPGAHMPRFLTSFSPMRIK